MPRPEPTFVTFEIDGRQVRAPAGAMLVDGAKYGDVEIPVFCYEPKLGAPVGACRMCLVEIEGIPKLQTACSTPVKDGMVVTTSSNRVKGAQNAVVEFLLVNHPLDCPVCDKGGECPLQDISYGWGAGRSRYIEPKRHFKKPLELSPLVAIDRERCILCFRCVRFSQEISEDYQLVFLERGDHTYVGTHDGRPYVGPFTGNIIDLCPVGALTNSAYRFRARPWDIELAGSVCTFCPSQCNVTFTVRDDDKVLRVYPRDNPEVDGGWMCDKGRWGYQKIHAADRITHPMVKDGGELREVSWERALAEAAAGLEKAGPRAAALVDGETSNEEGFLLARLMREVLGSPHVDSRANGSLDPEHARLLAAPELSASVSDIEYAETVVVLDTELVDESPILDLWVRKAARRHGTKIVVVTSRPGTLDATADAIVRFAPGAGEAALAALAAGLERVEPEEGEPRGREQQLDPARTADANVHPEAFGNPRRQGDDSGSATLDGLARAAGATPESVQNAAAILRGAGETVVLWGERLSHGDRGPHGVARLLALADALGVSATEGAGLLEVPAGPNARGLREVGCVPNLGPGLAAPAGGAGRGATEIAAGLADGELSALVLYNSDPLRTHPDRGAWERGLAAAGFVVAVSEFHNESTAGADVILPAEAYAEKEGTVTHPDGRVQRVRQAIGHRGEVRPGWNVLTDLTNRLGHGLDLLTAPMVTAAMTGAVPIYAGLTLEEIGGKGTRWVTRPGAVARPAGERSTAKLETPPELGEGLRLGTHRSLWAGPETRHAPILRFLEPVQEVELSPADAAALGVGPGDEVDLDVDGRRVRGRAALRHAVPTGSVFVIEGTNDENATALTNGRPREVSVTRVREAVGAGGE